MFFFQEFETYLYCNNFIFISCFCCLNIDASYYDVNQILLLKLWILQLIQSQTLQQIH
jgi:hypothetical protein